MSTTRMHTTQLAWALSPLPYNRAGKPVEPTHLLDALGGTGRS